MKRRNEERKRIQDDKVLSGKSAGNEQSTFFAIDSLVRNTVVIITQNKT